VPRASWQIPLLEKLPRTVPRKLLGRGDGLDFRSSDGGRTPPENQNEKDDEFRVTRLFGTILKAAANSFHFGCREFCQFGCFHKVAVFLVTLIPASKDNIAEAGEREKLRGEESDERAQAKCEWSKAGPN
jgi:hypothetical protein